MNPGFPFQTVFSVEAFGAQIRNAQRQRLIPDDLESAYIRSHGIRYVVEASETNADTVRAMVRDVWRLDVDVESLFQRYGDAPDVPDALKRFYLVSLPGAAFTDLEENPYDAAYTLLARSSVLTAEPDLPYTQFLAGTGNALQSGSGAPPPDLAWSLRNIRADRAWMLPPSAPGLADGQGVSVAHLDTGWTDHIDLDRQNFDQGHRIRDFLDPNGNALDPLAYRGNPGHGTRTGSVIMSQGHVSGIPPGTLPPGRITGVARLATYVPIRCIESVIVIFNSDVARAVHHATAFSCDVISMSLGGRPMKALRAAINHATAQQLLVVCAAGNKVGLTVWPANYIDSIAVAASNFSDQPWVWTSRGAAVDISAPGEDVWKADPDPKGAAVSPGSGTSYATATLAGAAALWLAFHNKQTLIRVARGNGQTLQELFRKKLRQTARVPVGWNTSLYGAGILNVEGLLQSRPSTPTLFAPSTQPIAEEYLRSCIRLAKRRLRALSPVWKADAVDAFDHELASIFLDEAAHVDLTEVSMELRYVLGVVSKRGSRTLRLAIGL